MKPIPQISPSQHAGFPLTDYAFQATDGARPTSSAIASKKKPYAFWKVSSEFFAAEMSRDYVFELLLFMFITGISAWPIISAIVAVTRLVRNY
jgi:hypothetical protein